MSEIPESSVTYEELADLERDFDDVEAEMSAYRLSPSHPPGGTPRFECQADNS